MVTNLPASVIGDHFVCKDRGVSRQEDTQPTTSSLDQDQKSPVILVSAVRVGEMCLPGLALSVGRLLQPPPLVHEGYEVQGGFPVERFGNFHRSEPRRRRVTGRRSGQGSVGSMWRCGGSSRDDPSSFGYCSSNKMAVGSKFSSWTRC